MTALTAQGIIIMHLFVVQVIVGATYGNTQYSVNKQTNNIFNLLPLRDRNYQLLLEAHSRFFIVLFIKHYFSGTIYCASGRSAQSRAIKNHSAKLAFYQKELSRVVLPVSC